ncbi:hypothetical protein VTP01DRAFT_9114 [Rhizomucor pusillus]|uniref:uncharacterized protein n=1 Tax=Rhizomucor pusillus TaxID=4840 RepID=UPI0037449288
MRILVRKQADGSVRSCTLFHIQLALSFVGVKHAHIQQILDRIVHDPLLDTAHDRSIELEQLLTRLKAYFATFHYTNSLTDLKVAWDIVQRQDSVCILLGGTSGCGKSTLASLLAHRIGITTVLSTDHIRSLLRSFDTENPLLWASSYHAGETLPQRRNEQEEDTVAGYEAQSQLILDTLDKMLTGFRNRRESLVIEGVGLSIENIKALLKKHPNCIPLIVYISNEQKHAERFAIRAKYMTLAPRANKYIRYFDNIRLIQDHLCRQADKCQIPKIDNTNVDRSLAILHMTIVNVLSRMRQLKESGQADGTSNILPIVSEEFAKVYRVTWSSKQMLRRIRENSTLPRIRKTEQEDPLLDQQRGGPQHHGNSNPVNTIVTYPNRWKAKASRFLTHRWS